jgi:hypothetical protein
MGIQTPKVTRERSRWRMWLGLETCNKCGVGFPQTGQCFMIVIVFTSGGQFENTATTPRQTAKAVPTIISHPKTCSPATAAKVASKTYPITTMSQKTSRRRIISPIPTVVGEQITQFGDCSVQRVEKTAILF